MWVPNRITSTGVSRDIELSDSGRSNTWKWNERELQLVFFLLYVTQRKSNDSDITG